MGALHKMNDGQSGDNPDHDLHENPEGRVHLKAPMKTRAQLNIQHPGANPDKEQGCRINKNIAAFVEAVLIPSRSQTIRNVWG
jgi:hypothetical protein